MVSLFSNNYSEKVFIQRSKIVNFKTDGDVNANGELVCNFDVMYSNTVILMPSSKSEKKMFILIGWEWLILL